MQEEKSSRLLKDLLSKELLKKKPLMKPSYYKTYKNNTEHLTLWLYEKSIVDMTEDAWNDFFDVIGEKYSASKVSQYKTVLNSVCNTAVIDGLISENPVKAISIGERVAQSVDVYSEEELMQLLTASNGYESEKALIQLIISTGMTISELMALTVCDYDAVNSQLTISKALILGKLVKSNKERLVLLDSIAVKAMEKLISLVKGNAPENCQLIVQGNKVETFELTFLATSSKTNKRFSSVESFRQTFFKGYCEEAGVRYLAPSHLRDTGIIKLIQVGTTPAWVVEQVGHTDVKNFTYRYKQWIEASNQSNQVISCYCIKNKSVAANDAEFTPSSEKQTQFSLLAFLKSLLPWGNKAA
jgi:integrase